jgi:hypothetical protein
MEHEIPHGISKIAGFRHFANGSLKIHEFLSRGIAGKRGRR